MSTQRNYLKFEPLKAPGRVRRDTATDYELLYSGDFTLEMETAMML